MRRLIALLTGLACLAVIVVAAAAKKGDNEDIVKRYVDLWNKGNLTTASEFVASYVTRIGPTAETSTQGLSNLSEYITQVRNNYKDFKVSVKDIETDGDRAVLKWSVKGTYRGTEFPEAVGEKVKSTGTSIYRITNGKIVQERASWDFLGVFEQLGVEAPLETPQQNIALAKRFVTELYEKGNMDVAYEIIDPDHVFHVPAETGVLRGPSAVQRRAMKFYTAFPDLKFEYNQIVAADDLVAIQWTFFGTHEGTFLGVEPTNKTVAIPGLSMSRIREGKIVESWGFWDTGHLFDQLGVAPKKTGTR